MRKLNQSGAVDVWIIAFAVTLLCLIGALGFGLSAYAGKQDYKNNVDEKVATAVSEAEKKQAEKKEAEFAEREKQPYRTYNGPAAYASLSITYPKTWAAYIDESGQSNAPVDGYLNPAFVPSIQKGNNIALRFQVLGTSYTNVVKSLEAGVKSGKIKTSAYSVPKVSGVVGLRVDGEVVTGKQGSMVILPVRDKTVKVWTESTQFVPDLNTVILPNMTFVP